MSRTQKKRLGFSGAQYAVRPVHIGHATIALPSVNAEPNLVSAAYMNINKPDLGADTLIAAADRLFRSSDCAVPSNLANFEDNTLPLNPQSWSVAWMSSDCVQPNDAGCVQQGRNYFSALLPLMEKMLGRCPTIIAAINVEGAYTYWGRGNV